MKVPFIISADLEPLLEKMSTCHNSSQKSSTIKIKTHIPFGFSLFTHFSFDLTKKSLIVINVKPVLKAFVRI